MIPNFAFGDWPLATCYLLLAFYYNPLANGFLFIAACFIPLNFSLY